MSDTIYAPCTPPGGAISIVRISGPDAIALVDRIFQPAGHQPLSQKPDRHATFGRLVDGSETLDECIATAYRAPHSYTGEDTVELSLHGSPYILRRTLSLLSQQGARLAEAGEYTKRAFLNQRLDLAQAEAVATLVAATSRAEHHAAMSQMRGGYRTELHQLHDALQQLTALVELELDFSDHEDLQFAPRTQLASLTDDILRRIDRLAQSFRLGRTLKDGIPVAIVGDTNAGKSTLLNALLNEERAITSPLHGTTRDIIEDTLTLSDGRKYRLLDTAGLRHTHDTIEALGIKRSLQAIEQAEIIILLLDPTRTPAENNARLQDITARADHKPLLVCWNKSDLAEGEVRSSELSEEVLSSELSGYQVKADAEEVLSSELSGYQVKADAEEVRSSELSGYQVKADGRSVGTNNHLPKPRIESEFSQWQASVSLPNEATNLINSKPRTQTLRISAKTHQGIEALEQALTQAADTLLPQSTDAIVTSERHHQALLTAHAALQRVAQGLQTQIPTDLLAADLRDALAALAEILGRITPETTLHHIFQHFCVGK